MATSLAVPVAYISVLVTALAIFSRVYRRRKLAEKTSFEPWFPTHPSRDLYITLLSSQNTSNTDEEKKENNTEKLQVTENLLKSALLLRATEDVKRIWRIRDDKMALTSLHQRGLVGDETMARFAAAEKELEAEIVDVVQEANSFKLGWGGMIFATATEMAHAERTREVVMSAQKIRIREEKRIAFRKKYLPQEPTSTSTSSSTPALTPAPGLASSNSTNPTNPSSSSPSTTDTGAAAPATAAVDSTPPTLSDPIVSTPQKVPSGSGSGSGEGSKANSPSASGASTPAVMSPGSGGVGGGGSTSNTPSKNTPSKKKGKKK